MVPGEIESTVKYSFEAVKFDSLFIREVAALSLCSISKELEEHMT